MSWSTTTYLTLPYLTLPYLTLPYLTLPYITLPYITLPHLTVLTLRYITLHYLTLLYGEGVLPPSAEASGGPNAHRRPRLLPYKKYNDKFTDLASPMGTLE